MRTFLICITFIYVCVQRQEHPGIKAKLWRSEDNLQESDLSQGSNTGCQAWWQVPLPAEPSSFLLKYELMTSDVVWCAYKTCSTPVLT